MIKKYIQKYLASDFLKNTLILISGVGIAQTIPILMQSYLRRVFSPEDFGAFAVYMSLLGIIVIITGLRYQLAIVVPKQDRDAANIFYLVLIINAIFFVLLNLIILVFKNKLSALINFPAKYDYWLYFLPFSVFLFSVYDAINYWLIRKKAFKASAINKVSRRSFEGLTQFGFALSKQPLGLVIGDIIGNIANNISGIIQVKKYGLKLSFFNKQIIANVFKSYSDFPKNSIPALLNTAGTLLPVIFINKFFSDTVTGYFDLTRIVLSVPGILISTAISKVLLQKISEKVNNSLSIKKDLLSVFFVLFTISILEIIIIINFAPQLFGFIFGEHGVMSGVYAQILIFSFTVKFMISPLSFVLIAIKKIKIISFWQVIYFLSILLLIFYKNKEFSSFITIYTIIDIVLYFFYLSMIIISVKKYEKLIIQKR